MFEELEHLERQIADLTEENDKLLQDLQVLKENERRKIAATVLQGLIVSKHPFSGRSREVGLAKIAVEYTDALIYELGEK